MKPPAVVLLSGGLDSATVAAMAQRDGFAVHALSFRYGQRHDSELTAAARVAAALCLVEHRVATIDLGMFGGSALTDSTLEVPKGRDEAAMGQDVPITYVPARNTIFLSFAMAWAEVLGAAEVFIGVNALDYSGYPDCRPEFIKAFQAMARLGTRAGVEGTELTIHTPLIAMTKARIIEAGTQLGVDYAMTVSCYEADERGAACGECDACVLRRKGFVEAGIADPTTYR
ncbi:MAG: 7-cyano-7-deazaguanine synthase QueC [Acidimicrobiales bacterium]